MDEEKQDEIARFIEADSFNYMTHEGLIRALGMDRQDICMACLDRNYPTPAGRELDRENYASFLEYGRSKQSPKC